MKPSFLVVAAWVLVTAGCGAKQNQPCTAAGPTQSKAETARPYQTNIVEQVRNNNAYRRVLFTGARSQLVAMTIPPGGDIGMESHAHVEQLIFIMSGQGKAVVNGVESPVVAGDVVVATPGTKHNILNTGSEPLRIYTIYAPANHIDGRVHMSKSDAENDKADQQFGDSVR